MKLVVHIGTEKTGSTAIQNWLDANDESLARDGVCYAKSLGRPSNRLIAVYARDADDPDDGFIAAGVRDAATHAAFLRALKAEFVAEAERARQRGCHTFIVSSEHLHSRLTTVRAVGRLRALFAPLFATMEIIAFVRPQAELFQSRLSVEARNGALDEHYERQLHEDLYYDYYKLWRRWSACFERVAFLAWNRCPDVVETFCRRLQIDASGRAEAAKRPNEKLDRRTAEIIHDSVHSPVGRKAPHLALGIYPDDLPVAQPLRASREQARAANTLYRAANEALVRVCPNLTLADLEADLDEFPEVCDVESVLRPRPHDGRLGNIVVRLNAELELERVRRMQLQALLEMAQGRRGEALRELAEARARLDGLRELDFESVRTVAGQLTAAIGQLETLAREG